MLTCLWRRRWGGSSPPLPPAGLRFKGFTHKYCGRGESSHAGRLPAQPQALFGTLLLLLLTVRSINRHARELE